MSPYITISLEEILKMSFVLGVTSQHQKNELLKMVELECKIPTISAELGFK